MNFKYKRIERPEPAGMTYVPYIPVILTGPKDSVEVVALLDSGADVSVLPKGVAELLGIDLKGDKEEVVGVGGKAEAVETNVSIVVSGAHEKYAFRIKVKVILDDSDDRFPIILGRDGFFDKFDITFKENQRKIILKKN